MLLCCIHDRHRHSPWCLTSGLAFAFLTLVFWQSSSPVFLDRACIHQGDPRLKTEGILNIAAFLKASKSLVVAFDETYLSRTWCVFEIAAFLKSHEGESPPPVVIKQIAVAPTIFYLVITVALVLLYTICLPAAGYLIYLQLAFMVAFAVTNHIMFLQLFQIALDSALSDYWWFSFRPRPYRALLKLSSNQHFQAPSTTQSLPSSWKDQRGSRT